MSIILEDGQEYNIERVIRESKCKCGLSLQWFEEHSGFEAQCKCGLTYNMYTTMAVINVTEPDEPIDKEEMTDGNKNEYYRAV